MPGVTKRKYQGEIMRFNKSIKRPLKLLIEVLPYEYDADTILKTFKKLYPFEWQTIVERYNQYKEKDEFLVKVGKKKRYKPETPNRYIINLPAIKRCLSKTEKEKHKQTFNEKIQKQKLLELESKRTKNITKKVNKINNEKELMQTVEPLYIDVFIAAYHKKGISTVGKIEIVKELQKYDCEKSTIFFYKINDSEKNNQIRNMAFKHLQKMGKYAKLRKKFKGKKKVYMIEKSDFTMTPQDLLNNIEANNVQNKKIFDVFISHSSKDSAFIKKTIKALNRLGFNSYCDWTSDSDFLKRELVSDFTKVVLKKRLEQSKKLLFVRTKNSIVSDWVDFELDYYRSLKKPLFCLNLLDDKQLDGFGMVQYDDNNEIIIWGREIE